MPFAWAFRKFPESWKDFREKVFLRSRRSCFKYILKEEHLEESYYEKSGKKYGIM